MGNAPYGPVWTVSSTGPIETLQFGRDSCRAIMALILGLELGSVRIESRQIARTFAQEAWNAERKCGLFPQALNP